MTTVNQDVIAKRLGISRTTVSRCFTNHPGINPKTRAKVFALAAELGYTHQERREETRTRTQAESLDLGVLVCVDLPNFEHNVHSNPGQELLNGLSDFARGANVKLDLNFVRPEDLHLDSPSYKRIAASRRRSWDGVILIYPFPRTVLDELIIKYPVVSLVEQYSGAPLNTVDVDHHRGVRKSIDRFRALGHERIGFFTYRYSVEASWALRRFGAFVEHIAELGLPIRPEDIINAGPRNALNGEAARERMYQQTKDGVTAWVCAADHQGYELMEYVMARGLKVPRDVSLSGFDGVPPPKGAMPLSTVQIPFHQIGVTGGKRLLDLIEKRFVVPQHILLDCELKDGATAAKPRK